jgi:transcriptional regulator with XRE-family HTH domain
VQRKRAIDGRVGDRIAEIRESRGLSQGKLARAIGVTTGAVRAYAAPGAGCGPTG